MSRYIGDVSAYALAVSQGYTGTEEEYAELMASYATVAQTAVNAKDAAVAANTAAQSAKTAAAGSANTAQTAATTATSKASEATTAAGTATTKAAEASQSASTASTAASTASTKASEATTAAGTATTAKNDAVAAQTAAQAAQTAAETAQGKAEDAAESVSASAAQIATNTADITELKEDLNNLTGDIYGGTILINESIKTSASVLYTIMCNIAVGDVIKVSTTNASVSGSVTIRTKNGNTNVDTLIDGVPATIEYTLETSATGVADRLVLYTSDKATDFDVFIMSKDKESVVEDIIYNYQIRYSTLPDIVKNSFSFSDFDDVAFTFANTNKLLKVGTGELVTYNGSKVTDMIDCSAYSALSYTGKTYLSLGCVAFYNRYGVCIATVPNAEGAATYNNEIIPIPINAKYMRIADNSGALGGTCAVSLPSTITPINSAFKWYGKKWVCVGDSLTEHNIRATKNYHDYVAEATGITVVNMGVSGSGYARSSEDNKAFYQRISSCPTDADVVTIFGSFNDLSSGLSIGSVDDTGTTTIAGCINTTIDNLQSIIPLANIGIVSPTPWSTVPPSTSGNGYNYVDMLKAICEKRSIPFLDLWRCSNLRPWDSSFLQYAYSHDEGNGVHPDENGHKLIAPRFEGFLDTLLLT